MKQKLNLLLVISYFYPAWSYGGPGKLVCDLAGKLGSSGHKTTVYTTDAFDQYRRRSEKDNSFLTEKNFRVFFFKNIHNRFVYRTKFFFSPGMFFKAVREIRRYDLIHLHEVFTGNVVIIVLLAIIYKIPYVFSAHGTLDDRHLFHRSFLKKLFLRAIGRFIFEKSRGFIAATVEEVKEYQKLGVPIAKIITIQNGIDITPYLHLPPFGRFRNKYKIASGQKIITYLGRIHRLKGLAVLVRAFSQAKFSDSLLVIAGSDDGYFQELKIVVEKLGLGEKVIMPGIISGLKKLELYRDSDIFVYPSPVEGFSIAVLEAAASLLPLVITPGCKFKEVKNHQAGLIVAPSEKLFARAIRQLLENDSQRRIMGENARRLVKNKFTVDIMADKLINYYRKIINK